MKTEDLGRPAAALERQGKYAEAEAALGAILELQPAHSVARYALGTLKLRQGNYIEGWPLYEARTDPPGRRGKPKLSFPEWVGQPIASLLVLPEQGFGDVIQFSRYIPELVARGVRVTLGCQPALTRLLTPLGADLLAMEGAVQLPRHDAWILAGSLPRLFGTIPTEPYLPGPGPGGSGPGVVVSGNPKHPGDAERSLNADAAAAIRDLGRDLLPEATGAHDFEHTRQLIEALDNVVCVDTAVAHLAGAMGKRTYLLLPHTCDWRWGAAGAHSQWYPSMTLLRQPGPGDWSAPISELKALLG